MLIPCTVLASPPSSTYGQTALELKHLLVKHSPVSSISDDGRETIATASSQSTVSHHLPATKNHFTLSEQAGGMMSWERVE